MIHLYPRPYSAGRRHFDSRKFEVWAGQSATMSEEPLINAQYWVPTAPAALHVVELIVQVRKTATATVITTMTSKSPFIIDCKHGTLGTNSWITVIIDKMNCCAHTTLIFHEMIA